MTSFIQELGPVALVAVVVWYAGGPLLRLAATSCFACAAGLLALGDLAAAAGATGCGAVCWIGGQVLYRARRGRWKSPRAAALLGRGRRRRNRRGAAGAPS